MATVSCKQQKTMNYTIILELNSVLCGKSGGFSGGDTITSGMKIEASLKRKHRNASFLDGFYPPVYI